MRRCTTFLSKRLQPVKSGRNHVALFIQVCVGQFFYECMAIKERGKGRKGRVIIFCIHTNKITQEKGSEV